MWVRGDDADSIAVVASKVRVDKDEEVGEGRGEWEEGRKERPCWRRGIEDNC